MKLGMVAPLVTELDHSPAHSINRQNSQISPPPLYIVAACEHIMQFQNSLEFMIYYSRVTIPSKFHSFNHEGVAMFQRF